MVFLAGWLMSDRRLKNPTILMVTDRQDLDGQLFNAFANARDLLQEQPQQANSRAELRKLLLNRPSGGILFTTIQKFGLQTNTSLSDRHNVVVIADEAHRSHYGLKATIDHKTGAYKFGFAGLMRDALPNATFLAFTGTPISQEDRNTQVVFGNYISIYDIRQAVDDGATVCIFYESRLAKITLQQENLPAVDADVEELLENELVDESTRERAKSKWSTLAKIVGTDARLKQVAKDILDHYETRRETQQGETQQGETQQGETQQGETQQGETQQGETQQGKTQQGEGQEHKAIKAMVVCMTRDICARLYKMMVALRPEWHADDHRHGAIKVVMTAAAHDSPELQRHHTNRQQRKHLEHRFKDPADPLIMVLVVDMWLTGFDVPCLTTMYIDKPMHGANLAQAIARVNRVFQDKPGGLVVDYIGIAPQLRETVATYSATGREGQPMQDVTELLRILKEKQHVARQYLHPVKWENEYRKKPLPLIPQCMDRILQQGKRQEKLLQCCIRDDKGIYSLQHLG